MPSFPREILTTNHASGLHPRSAMARTVLAIACAGMAHLLAGCAPEPHASHESLGATEAGTRAVERFPVTIRQPAGSPSIKTGTFDEKGNPVAIACATCHSTKPSNPGAKLGVPLTAFHQGLKGQHGNLSCVSCHNP